MSGEGLKMYLFLILEVDGNLLKDSYLAVKQAQINDKIANKTERVGKRGVIFTTNLILKEVKDKLNIKKDEHYLLIELTGNVSSETISGFLPDTDIDELKNLNLENLKDNAEWLEEELSKAVANENFERAAKLRDKIKNENNGKR